MQIVLGGGGSAEQEAAVLDHFASLVSPGGRVLYLPLAADDPTDPRFPDWIPSVLEPRGIKDIVLWTSLERRWPEELARFSGIFIGGGNTFLLMSRLREGGFEDALIARVREGTAIYGGSAGAILLGAELHAALHLDRNRVGLTNLSGLGLCAGAAVWPHYHASEDPRIEALVRERGIPILSLPEDSGARIGPDSIGALGTGTVKLWTREGPKELSRWESEP